MTESRAVVHLIDLCRRRRLTHLAVEQAAWAACAGMVAFIALLLAGTQVLAWYWPPALLTAGLAMGAWRLRSRIPAPYEVAQDLDRRLELRDLLSTAFHFLHVHSRLTNVERVAAEAETAALGIRPDTAFPLTRPRALVPLLALFLLAAALLGLRYGRLSTLALNAPLIHFDYDPFTALFAGKAKSKEKAPPPPGAEQVPLDTSLPGVQPDGANPDNKLLALEDQYKEGSALANQAGDKKSSSAMDQNGPSEEGEASTEGKPSDTLSSKDSNSPKPNDSPSGKPQAAKDSSTSLLDKMRDALASLVDKIKPPSNEAEQKMAQKKGEPSSNRSQAKGEANLDSKSDKSSDPAEGEGQKSSQADPNQAEQSNQPKTGMGRSEGKKDTELAEQLAAMGKLTEILGRRAATLQGEVTVEVTATRQQLRTPYLNRRADHSDTGAEIHRDEVPLQLQDYIQRYYTNLRAKQ